VISAQEDTFGRVASRNEMGRPEQSKIKENKTKSEDGEMYPQQRASQNTNQYESESKAPK